MHFIRHLCLVFVLAFIATDFATAQKKTLQPDEVVLTGKLTPVLGIGGETTGWSLELKSETTTEEQTLDAIEVSGPPERLEKLANQEVKARGFVKRHHGVERKDWLVLEVIRIHLLNPPKPAS